VAPPILPEENGQIDLADHGHDNEHDQAPENEGAGEQLFGQEPNNEAFPGEVDEDEEDDEDYVDTDETGTEVDHDEDEERHIVMRTDGYASETEHPLDREGYAHELDRQRAALEQEHDGMIDYFDNLNEEHAVTVEETGGATENSDVIVDDTRTEAQVRHNLRPNRAPDCSHRLGHIMDEPSSTKNYDTQLLQTVDSGDDPGPSPLRIAVQEVLFHRRHLLTS
jgi:hypothetical protein